LRYYHRPLVPQSGLLSAAFLTIFNLSHENIYLYSETNVMQFLLNLLTIKGLYIFRALLAHPQDSLHKQHLVYLMRVVCWLLPGLEKISLGLEEGNELGMQLDC
jgi:hypothetical protein